MLDQALDFRVESDVFFDLLDSLEEPDWSRPTQFKDWTINDVLALCPPLVITDDEIGRIIDTMAESLRAVP